MVQRLIENYQHCRDYAIDRIDWVICQSRKALGKDWYLTDTQNPFGSPVNGKDVQFGYINSQSPIAVDGLPQTDSFALIIPNPNESKFSYNKSNEINYLYELNLTLVINQFDVIKRDFFERLQNFNDVTFIVKMSNGSAILVGETNGCNVSIDYGADKLTLNATCLERLEPREIVENLANYYYNVSVNNIDPALFTFLQTGTNNKLSVY